MVGNPSWANTEPSTNSTKEWITDCGCTTASMSIIVEVVQMMRASITSSALFASVAESIVILAPMSHVGCLKRVGRSDNVLELLRFPTTERPS